MNGCTHVTIFMFIFITFIFVLCLCKSSNKKKYRNDCHNCGYEWFTRRGDISCPVCGLKCNEHQKHNEDCTQCLCTGNWSGDDCNTCPDGYGGNDCLSNIDCEGSWTITSECDKDCGRGTEKLIYNVTQPKQGDGQECPAKDKEEKTQECNTQPCPIDCIGEWTDYGDCDAICGSGKQTRTYNVTTQAQHNGKECSAENGEQEQRACESKPCPSCGANSKLVNGECECQGNYTDLCELKTPYDNYSEPFYFWPNTIAPEFVKSEKYFNIFPYVKSGPTEGTIEIPNGDILTPDVGVVKSVAKEGKEWVVVGEGSSENGKIAYSCDDGISWYTIDQLNDDNKVIGTGNTAFSNDNFDRVWKEMVMIPANHPDKQGRYYIWRAVDSTSTSPSESIIYSNDGLNWKRGLGEPEQLLTSTTKEQMTLESDGLKDIMKDVRWIPNKKFPRNWSGTSWKITTDKTNLFFLHGFFHTGYKGVDNVYRSSNEYKRPLTQTKNDKIEELRKIE